MRDICLNQKNLILNQRNYYLLITITIDLYDITKWIFTEYYLVAFPWNNLPKIASLSSSSFRNFLAQVLNIRICYADMCESGFPIFKVLLTPLCFWINIFK